MRSILSVLPGLAFAAALPGQTYSLSVQDCNSVTKCVSPGQSRKGTLTPVVHDQVETQVGDPFDIDKADAPLFYGKSSALVDGVSLELHHRVQIANFPKWILNHKKGADALGVPADAAVVLVDVLTIIGGTGKGNFVPVYRVRAKFTRPEHPYLTSFVALCPGIPGSRCAPRVWNAPPGSSSLDVLYQPDPGQTLKFEFGVPFRYQINCYSKILPPVGEGATILESTFREEETVDSFRVELTGAVVANGSGHPIPGTTISSQSGIPYAVREPLR